VITQVLTGTRRWHVEQGDVLQVLHQLPDAVVQCCVTSPPYWGLRDYGLPATAWGGVADCAHRWRSTSHRVEGLAAGGTGATTIAPSQKRHAQNANNARVTSARCSRCKSWRGCLGLEPTPELFVQHLVEVFAQVRRVLRPDGVLWLNMGDCYSRDAGNTFRGYGKHVGGAKSADAPNVFVRRGRVAGLKPKDLVGLPWRVAFALQAAGWYLRADVIWHKPSPMPESVTDRPTKAHEYVFLLSKSERYTYDAEAIKDPLRHPKDSTASDVARAFSRRRAVAPTQRQEPIADEPGPAAPTMRNARSVWTIASHPFAGAHFATMPPKLAERCVRAGSAPGDLVLDPFSGAGTTGLVATRLGRRYLGIELGEAYVEMSRRRIESDAPLLNWQAEAR
jgi:DNA modification methylase